jgi:hypothetical protein
MVGEVTVKQGYEGFACAASVPMPSGEGDLSFVIFAGTAEQAAAICELITQQDMSLRYVSPAIVGGPIKA